MSKFVSQQSNGYLSDNATNDVYADSETFSTPDTKQSTQILSSSSSLSSPPPPPPPLSQASIDHTVIDGTKNCLSLVSEKRSLSRESKVLRFQNYDENGRYLRCTNAATTNLNDAKASHLVTPPQSSSATKILDSQNPSPSLPLRYLVSSASETIDVNKPISHHRKQDSYMNCTAMEATPLIGQRRMMKRLLEEDRSNNNSCKKYNTINQQIAVASNGNPPGNKSSRRIFTNTYDNQQSSLHASNNHSIERSSEQLQHPFLTIQSFSSDSNAAKSFENYADMYNPDNMNFTNDDNDNDDDQSVSTSTSLSSIATLTTIYAENFRESLLLPFVDEEGTMSKIVAGIASLMVIGTILGIVLVTIVDNTRQSMNHNPTFYEYTSSIIGYNYFVLWSACFYPQITLNFRRKSTKGLSNDFCILNCFGWTYYTIYLTTMYSNINMQQFFEQRFPGHGTSTVKLNDVLFSIHATVCAYICLCQVFYYNFWFKKKDCYENNYQHEIRKKKQISHKETKPLLKLKLQTWVMIYCFVIPTVLIPIMIITDVLSAEWWLDYLYMLSYFKIFCTLTKYTKQVSLNCQRKSTAGWNIWYNFLECSGGSLSMIQMFVDCYNINHSLLAGIRGNIAKFLLGLVTIFFDMLFFLQHYVWYYDGSGNLDNKCNTAEHQQHDKTRHIRARSRFEISIPPEISTISCHTSVTAVGIRHPIDCIDSVIESDDLGSFDDDFDGDAADGIDYKGSLKNETGRNGNNGMSKVLDVYLSRLQSVDVATVPK